MEGGVSTVNTECFHFLIHSFPIFPMLSRDQYASKGFVI